jgi:hypothetical protein
MHGYQFYNLNIFLLQLWEKMGQRQSTLQPEEITYFTKNTPCNIVINITIFQCAIVSISEIKRLYNRFQQLDRQSFGLILPEDLLSIPELAMNPLSKCLLDFTFKQSRGDNDDKSVEGRDTDGMDFESFVDVMSVFHLNTPLEIKLKCISYIYSLNFIFFRCI